MRRWRRHAASLLTRVLLVEAATILLAAIILPFVAHSVMSSTVETIQSDLLARQARIIALSVAPPHGPSHLWTVRLSPDESPIYTTGYDGRAFAVLDARGAPLVASPFARPAQWPSPACHGPLHRFSAGSLLGLALQHQIAQQTVCVVVTQDQTGPGAVVDDVVRDFMSRTLVILVGLLLVMALINGAIMWRSFGQVRTVARDAARLGPHHPGARLNPRGLPSESIVLVEAINGLLDRIEDAIGQQEEFAGNVAHELRTPLATLQLGIANLPDSPSRAAMEREIARISHVLAQLRDLASMENARKAALEPLDLADFVIERVAEHGPAILHGGRTIAVTGAERALRTSANRGLLTIALDNLLTNAAVHTPIGTAIEVSLGRDGETGAARISVADDGPGVTGADHANLVRRFWRADHRRADGAGLGLSIVQRIAAAHHGTLTIDRAPQGGARFTLLLATMPP